MIPIKQTKFINELLGTRGNCLAACVASILDKRIEDIPKFEEMDFGNSMINYMESIGFKFCGCGDLKSIDQNKGICGGYFIAGGISPRGSSHAVVCKNSEIIHDPHWSNDGIKIKYHWFFEKKNEL